MPTTVVIGLPPRGGGSTGEPVAITLSATRVSITTAWGLQPATATVEWVNENAVGPIQPGARMTIQVGGHYFVGVSTGSEAVLASGQGSGVVQEFQDYRVYLQWDTVFGAFNLQETQVFGNTTKRVFRHLLPTNAAAGVWTYSDVPYAAWRIMDMLLDAPTGETTWTREYNGVLDNPVYDLDFSKGRLMGDAIQEVTQRAGTIFTLIQSAAKPYDLHWGVKGVGTEFTHPALSDNRRLGLRFSGHPGRITIVGERNEYHALNVEVFPDWAPGWNRIFDVDALAVDLYEYETDRKGGTGSAYHAAGEHSQEGYLRAAQRARTITVEEYARLRDTARPGGVADGDTFRDRRWYGGRSRLFMPAALYLQQILFRAYRIPRPGEANYSEAKHSFINWQGVRVPLSELDISDRACWAADYLPSSANGDMVARSAGEMDTEEPGNGLGIVQGVQLLSNVFAGLSWEDATLDNWTSLDTVWGQAPFQVEPAGDGTQVILFDEPVMKLTNLMAKVDDYPVPLAFSEARLQTGQRAVMGLTFLVEVFNYRKAGAGLDTSKDGLEGVPGLNGQYLLAADGSLDEIAFADGETASYKADVIATGLLNRAEVYRAGGYQYQGSSGQLLTPTVDRVSVDWDASNGLTENVDFTSERQVGVDGWGRPVLEQPRSFERRIANERLLPGERELRQQARDQGYQARMLKGSPAGRRSLRDALHRTLGFDAPTTTVVLTTDAAGTRPTGAVLPAGTPLWREGSATRAEAARIVSPRVATPLVKPIFVGVTVEHEAPVAGGLKISRTGSGNVIMAQVKIPDDVNELEAGTAVGYSAGNTYLAPAAAGGTDMVGKTQRKLTTTTGGQRVFLVPVQVSGSGGALRMLLCDANGESHYYLVDAQLDSNQNP